MKIHPQIVSFTLMLSFLIRLTTTSSLFSSSSLFTYVSLIIVFIGFSSTMLHIVKVGVVHQVCLDSTFSHVFYSSPCLAIKNKSYQKHLIQSIAQHWEEGRYYQSPHLPTENVLILQCFESSRSF